jgi:alpha-2-macroglobulin
VLVRSSANGEHPPLDAVEVGIPVRPGSSPRVVAVHGRLAAGETLHLPLELPADAARGFGEVELRASGSVVQRLGDALLALCTAPAPWPEPTIQRVLAVAALSDHLDAVAFGALPHPDELRSELEQDVHRVIGMVDPWLRGLSPARAAETSSMSPLLVSQAIHALALATEAGIQVDPVILNRIRRHLQGRVVEIAEFHTAGEAGNPAPRAGDPSTALLVTHTFYTAALLAEGASNAPANDALHGAIFGWADTVELDQLPAEALGWLLAALARSGADEGPRAASGSHDPGHSLADEALRLIENRALHSGPTATLRQGGVFLAAGPGGEGNRVVLASHRRTDAVVLAALLDARPDHPLVTPLALGLLAHRDGTAAGRLPETGWALMALGRYLSTHEPDPVSLNVRAWVGGTPMGEGTLGSPPAAGHAGWSVTLPELLEAEDGEGPSSSLVLQSAGTGTLHYRAGLRWAPDRTDEPPVERGFVVSRSYEPIDDPADVTRDSDGAWRIRAGARVRVRLTLTAPTRRYQVQLTDPIPAGFETVNTDLRGVGFAHDPEGGAAATLSRPSPAALAPGTPWFLAGATDWTELLFRWRVLVGHPWHTHREMLDDRVQLYAAFVPAGTYATTHVVRATLPGEFRAGPVRVEEYDAPEVYGRGAGERVIVIPR